MTVEQKLHKLDKRIAIFGLYLNAQQSVLNFKYGKDRSLKTLVNTMLCLKSNAMQSQIIASQPMPKFYRGGNYAKGGIVEKIDFDSMRKHNEKLILNAFEVSKEGFKNIDSQGDVYAKGCFEKAIEKYTSNWHIRHGNN